MPRTRVIFFRESDGSVPMLDWFKTLNRKAYAKCRAKVIRLQERGHELRRPDADFLRDGIYELRVGLDGINYRMLYFFHGNTAAVVSHGLVKEGKVPMKDIEKALKKKEEFTDDPEIHGFEGEF